MNSSESQLISGIDFGDLINQDQLMEIHNRTLKLSPAA